MEVRVLLWRYLGCLYFVEVMNSLLEDYVADMRERYTILASTMPAGP